MIERRYRHRKVGFVVWLNAQPGRRFKWSFVTDNGQSGEGTTGFGMEAAFKDGKDAAEVAIDGAANR